MWTGKGGNHIFLGEHRVKICIINNGYIIISKCRNRIASTFGRVHPFQNFLKSLGRLLHRDYVNCMISDQVFAWDWLLIKLYFESKVGDGEEDDYYH